MNTPVLDDVRSTARSAGAAAISTLEGALGGAADGVSDALASIDIDRFADVVGADQVSAVGRSSTGRRVLVAVAVVATVGTIVLAVRALRSRRDAAADRHPTDVSARSAA